jgi:hypothetical protein
MLGLNHETLSKLLQLRVALADEGVAASAVGAHGEITGGAYAFGCNGTFVRLYLTDDSGHAAMMFDRFEKPLSGVIDVEDAHHFASLMHQVDLEMWRVPGRFRPPHAVARLVDLAVESDLDEVAESVDRLFDNGAYIAPRRVSGAIGWVLPAAAKDLISACSNASPELRAAVRAVRAFNPQKAENPCVSAEQAAYYRWEALERWRGLAGSWAAPRIEKQPEMHF